MHSSSRPRIPSLATRARTGFVGLLLALVAIVLVAASATAVVPGVNGLIAYTSLQDGNYEIYVMNNDGTGQSRLTNNPAVDSGPAFSPDGRRIAFIRNGDIWLMNPDGSDQRSIATHRYAGVSWIIRPMAPGSRSAMAGTSS